MKLLLQLLASSLRLSTIFATSSPQISGGLRPAAQLSTCFFNWVESKTMQLSSDRASDGSHRVSWGLLGTSCGGIAERPLYSSSNTYETSSSSIDNRLRIGDIDWKLWRNANIYLIVSPNIFSSRVNKSRSIFSYSFRRFFTGSGFKIGLPARSHMIYEAMCNPNIDGKGPRNFQYPYILIENLLTKYW